MISQRDLDLYLDKVAELQVVLMRAEDLCDILEDDHIDLIDVDEVRHYIRKAQDFAEVTDDF